MAISSMKLVNIIGTLNKTDAVTNVLVESGVFQIDDAIDYVSNKAELSPYISNSNRSYSGLIERIKKLVENTKLDIEIVNPKEYKEVQYEEIDKFISDLEQSSLDIVNKEDELLKEIENTKSSIENASHFINLPVDIKKAYETKYIKIHFGKMPIESYEKLQKYNTKDYINFMVTSKDDYYYWGAYITPIDHSQEVDETFSSLYFEEISINYINGLPSKHIDSEKNKLKELENEYSKTSDLIENWKKENLLSIKKVFSRLCELNAYTLINNKTYIFREAFIIYGWVPNDYAENLEKKLHKIPEIEITLTDAKDEIQHSPPVKLKNRFFAKPFEFYTEMYGLPRYGEIDPSNFIAITYTILFGIMFGDVGHGLILTLVAIFMYKVLKMPLGRLLIPCGISSTIFGFVFGSVFGFEYLLNPFYKKVFGIDEKPIDVLDSKSINLIIYAAIGIGVVLLIIAMILNVYSSLKRKDIGNAFFSANGLAGIIFYTSLVVGLVCQLLLGIKIMSALYIIFLIVIPLLIIFFKEPLTKIIEGKKDLFPDGVGSFIADNFFELFEICLSFMTNTMSFLRVGAFVLVHAGMMLVVFAIADMFSLPGYIIAVVIGNIVVIGLEALLVGIQVLRLEYYEMFSKFYIGDGRKYEPINNKSINI